MACPHWLAWFTGVSNVKCRSIWLVSAGSVPLIHSTDCPATESTSWRTVERVTSAGFGGGSAAVKFDKRLDLVEPVDERAGSGRRDAGADDAGHRADVRVVIDVPVRRRHERSVVRVVPRLRQPRVAEVGREEVPAGVPVAGEVGELRGRLAVRRVGDRIGAPARQDDLVVVVEGAAGIHQRRLVRRVVPDVRAVALVHLDATGRIRSVLGELRVVDAHLEENALHRVDVARRDGRQRDVALALLVRHDEVAGRERVAVARGADGEDGIRSALVGDVDGELPPPAPELDDDRDVRARRARS